MHKSFYVCDLAELADPDARGFELNCDDGSSVEGLVVRQGDLVFAYVDSCPHTGVGLAWLPNRYLDVEGRYLQCATHGALFMIDNGYCIRGPCSGASLTALEAAIVDGRVLVRRPC